MPHAMIGAEKSLGSSPHVLGQGRPRVLAPKPQGAPGIAHGTGILLDLLEKGLHELHPSPAVMHA